MLALPQSEEGPNREIKSTHQHCCFSWAPGSEPVLSLFSSFLFLLFDFIFEIQVWPIVYQFMQHRLIGSLPFPHWSISAHKYLFICLHTNTTTTFRYAHHPHTVVLFLFMLLQGHWKLQLQQPTVNWAPSWRTSDTTHPSNTDPDLSSATTTPKGLNLEIEALHSLTHRRALGPMSQ